MSIKQHPRIEKFITKIKTLLAAGSPKQAGNRPERVLLSVHVQMELDLNLRNRE